MTKLPVCGPGLHDDVVALNETSHIPTYVDIKRTLELLKGMDPRKPLRVSKPHTKDGRVGFLDFYQIGFGKMGSHWDGEYYGDVHLGYERSVALLMELLDKHKEVDTVEELWQRLENERMTIDGLTITLFKKK